MHRSPGRFALIVASLVMVLLSVGTVWAQKLPPTKAKKPPAAAAAEPAAPQSAEQVDAYMGSLTDEQARKALSRTLKQQLAGKGQAGEVERGMEVGLGNALLPPGRRRRRLETQARGHGRDGRRGRRHPGRGLGAPDGGGGLRRFALPLLWLAGILAVGFLARAAFFRAAHDLTAAMATQRRSAGWSSSGGWSRTRSCRLLGLAVFAAVTFVLFVVFFDKGDPGYEFVSVYLLVELLRADFRRRGRGPLRTGCARAAPVPDARTRHRVSLPVDSWPSHRVRP